MAVYAGPDIVEDGLVLCLDAANLKSYPGSGVTWGDLSNTGNSGILKNGVSYNTSNKGTFIFDGSNDQVDFGAVSQIGSSLSGLSIEIILNISTVSGAIVAENGTAFNLNTFYLALENTGDSVIRFSFSTYGNNQQDLVATNFELTSGQWYHFTMVWESGLRNQIYRNGINVTQVIRGFTNNTLQNGNTNLFIGCRAGSSLFFNGNVSVFRIYNRALSSFEILQNFNALRGRFNI